MMSNSYLSKEYHIPSEEKRTQHLKENEDHYSH